MDFNIEWYDGCNRTSYIEDIITLKPKYPYVYILYTNIFEVNKIIPFIILSIFLVFRAGYWQIFNPGKLPNDLDSGTNFKWLLL